MIKPRHILLTLSVVVIVAVIIIMALFGDTAKINYPGGTFNVLVADNVIEQQKGLSSKELDNLEADGMIFVFNDKAEREFWMNGMKFDLDVVWIADGKIMKIDKNIKAPEHGEEPDRMRSQPFEVDMVLELPAGTVDEVGLLIGHLITVDLD